MHKWILLIVTTIFFIAGCSQPKVKPYEANPYKNVASRSAEWNFYQEGDYYIFYCDLIAQTGYKNKDPKRPEIEKAYKENLGRCITDAQLAMEKANQALTTVKLTGDMHALITSYYNDWQAYIIQLDINRQPEPYITAAYAKSSNELRLAVDN